MADGNLMIPGWSLVAVPIVYHIGAKAIQSWRGVEKAFVTQKDHKFIEEKRDLRCGGCEKDISELRKIIMPRDELERIFEGIRSDLKERKEKTHRLRGTLNKLVARQHLMHVMVVAIGTKVGADEAMEEAVRKHRELVAAAPTLSADEDDEVEPY